MLTSRAFWIGGLLSLLVCGLIGWAAWEMCR